MKTPLIILSTFLLMSFCQAQNSIKKDVPQFRESPKIDSLISLLINLPDNLKPAKNDSCLILSLSKNDLENFVLNAHALNHRETIFDLGGFLKNNKSLGYFEFDGYLIFVVGDAFMNKFSIIQMKKRNSRFY